MVSICIQLIVHMKQLEKQFEGSPVLVHIHTAYAGGRSCLGYSGSYGHYILIYGVSGDYYLIADPTKGFKKCYYSSINNARSSTNMKYYRLDPA